jgi:hypothetical protein
MGLSLIWSFISSKLGIIVIAALALGAFSIYHKIVVWNEQSKIESITKERDKALIDLYQERQKVADLEAKVRVKNNQTSLHQRAKKESVDVKQAVGDNNRDFLYNNWIRLHDYKNPAAKPKSPSGNSKGFKPKAKTKTAN